MLCPNCSSENRPGAKFCDECGCPLNDASVEQHDVEPFQEDGFSSLPTMAIPLIHVPEEQSASSEDPVFDADEQKTPEQDEQDAADAAEAAAQDDAAAPDELPADDAAVDPLKGLDESNFDELAILSTWEKGATMKMKPVQVSEDADAQRFFVAKEDDTARKRSKKPLIIALVSIVVIAAVVFGTWFFELWGGCKVPDVVALEQSSATQVLEEKGFTVRVELVKSDDEEGIVLLTDPQAGSRLEKGNEVVLHVSTSRIIPDVVGKTEEEAKALFESCGYTNVSFELEKSNEPEGNVLSVSPEQGQKAKSAYPVTVKVAESYRVPDVVGMGTNDAISALQEEGYEYVISRVYTESVPEGQVLSSSPAADEKLNSGETVTISVAVSRATELTEAARSSFGAGSTFSVDGVSYELVSCDGVSYVGDDVTDVNVTARAYGQIAGVTVYLDPAKYTWAVSWSADNSITSISSR